jgi:TrfA protein
LRRKEKEKMSSTKPVPKDLTESLERLGRAIAEKAERESLQPNTTAPEPKPTAQIVQLDFWEDGKRAAPNAVFRSALFPALNSQKRQFIKQTKLFSVSGVEVIFTGEQFDQSDLDVYLEILNLSKLQPLGSPVKFSAYSFLKSIGRQTGNAQHKWLHSVLIRLCGGVVDMTDHKKRYFGQLIHGGIRDEITLNYEITINPKFAVLFGFGMWATIDREQRRSLGRNYTSKALHTYYSSHAAPSAHNFETLAGIAGLTNSTNPRKLKADIIKAHDHLKAVGFLDGYEVAGDTIKPNIRHTLGQLRHIAQKTRKARSTTPQQKS